MKKLFVLGILLFFSVNVAFAATVGFVIEEDAADFPLIGRAFTPGIVIGNLYGLPDDGTGVFPTTFEFTSDVSGVGVTSNLEFSPLATGGTGFDIVGGVVVAADVLMNFDDPVNGGMQIRFNFDSMNLLHWNGGSGPVVGMGNQNGFSGTLYGEAVPTAQASSIPAMNNWGLAILGLMLGLFSFWVLKRQKIN